MREKLNADIEKINVDIEKANGNDMSETEGNEAKDVKEADKKKLKKGGRIIIIALAVLSVLTGVLYGVSRLTAQDKIDFTEKVEGIYYFPADYNADPEEDPAYMAKERRVWFIDDKGLGLFLDESNASSNSIAGLMYRYFEALKNGDAAAHEQLLSQSYGESYVIQKRFTCQKVHDINVKFNQGNTVDGVGRWYYRVSYEIYENNGTYRADIGSETARVMSFEIVYEGGEYKINSIGYITAK